MRLMELKAHRWTICAVMANDDSVPVVDELKAIRRSNRPAPASGFVALIDRCAEHGPYTLPDVLSHDLSDGIREFIKGQHRLLYFVSDGNVVVCSHTIMKKSPKVPPREIERAVRVREEYEAAIKSGQLQRLGSDEDVLQSFR